MLKLRLITKPEAIEVCGILAEQTFVKVYLPKRYQDEAVFLDLLTAYNGRRFHMSDGSSRVRQSQHFEPGAVESWAVVH